MVISALVIAFLSVALWLRMIDRVVRGGSFLAFEPRRPVPWTLVDILLAGFVGSTLLVFFQMLAFLSLRLPAGASSYDRLSPGQQIYISSAGAAASFVFLIIGYLVFTQRHRATNRDLGCIRETLERDVTIGWGGYLMLIVPMLLIHFLIQTIWPTKEAHPFIELLTANPRWEYWVPILVMAVGVAPIVEEFVFRVALQGWLEARAVKWERARGCAGHQTAVPVVAADLGDAEPLLAEPVTESDLQSMAPADGIRYAYATETESWAPAAESTLEAGEQSGIPITRWGQWLPIVTSSLLFSLAHLGQGSAPIALFFLALGLGYIYQRTHRVMPTIVVHFLVNMTAMIQLLNFVRNAPPR